MFRGLMLMGCLSLIACGGEGDDGWTTGGGVIGAPAGDVQGGGGGGGTTGALDPAQVAGQALFARNCARCHGANGGNIRGRRGISSVVRNGTGSMPSFPSLTATNISDIEAYLNAPSGGGAAATTGGGGQSGYDDDGDDD